MNTTTQRPARNDYWTTTVGSFEIHAYRLECGWIVVAYLAGELVPLEQWDKMGSAAAN